MVTTTVEITAVEVTESAMVQQSKVCSGNDDNCNITAIVVPTTLVVVALIVIICVNIVVVKMMNKRRKDNRITSNGTACVVENDLYQLVYINI